MPLSSTSKRASPPLAHKTRATAPATFVACKKGHWVNECLNKAHFVTKPCSDTAKPNRCSSGPSQCPGCGDSCGNHRYCQEEQGRQQANKQVWKYIPPTSTKSAKIVNGCTFHWCSKCMRPWWSRAHSMAKHTNHSPSSVCITNAQILDFGCQHPFPRHEVALLK